MRDVFVERNQKTVADENYPLCSFIAHKGVVPKTKYDRSFLVKSDDKKYKRTELNDFIYSSNNLETGSIGLNKFGNATISPVYSVFMVNGNSDFIAGLATTHRFIYEMIRFRQGVVYGQWRIHESDFLKIKYYIPQVLEQEKIGNLLSELDRTITLHEEKKRQLERLKSALLQKMFADKSGYPAVRFVGFENSWEQCKLSDISEKSYEKNTDNKYSTVLTNSAEYGIVKQRDFFDKDIANSSNILGYYIVRKNYFVYNPRISNQAKFGPINRNKLDETGIMSPLYLVFTVHDIDESFLETLFQTTTWHRFMYQNGDTGARADRFAIKDSTFMSMPIKVPPLEEQHKLALAFQQLDHTITLHDRKLELLKRMKQSLLQKMFI